MPRPHSMPGVTLAGMELRGGCDAMILQVQLLRPRAQPGMDPEMGHSRHLGQKQTDLGCCRFSDLSKSFPAGGCNSHGRGDERCSLRSQVWGKGEHLSALLN